MRELGQHLEVLVAEELLVGRAVMILWKTVSIAFDSPSARRIADVRAPSAFSTAACFSPSAVRICDCLTPWR